jgi:hypothetical protein
MCLTRKPDHDKARLVCVTRGLAYDSFATALQLFARFHPRNVVYGRRSRDDELGAATCHHHVAVVWLDIRT